MADWFVEHRMLVRRKGAPKFISLDDLSNHVGFRGVYAFSQQYAEEIAYAGTTRGVSSYPVYSDCLLLDFDNNADQALAAKNWLIAGGYGFEEYDSGNRSIHFHIPIHPMYGRHVPRTQKWWVQQHLPGSDTSYYHAGGVYRLPGTYHRKRPGHQKILLCSQPGQLLLVPDTCPTSFLEQPTLDRDPTVDYERMLLRLLDRDVNEGDRTGHMFKLLRTMEKIGYADHEIIQEMLEWNIEKASPPHDDSYVVKWIHQARLHGPRGNLSRISIVRPPSLLIAS